VSNVQGLTHNAQFCTNPVYGNALAAPSVLATPSNTCPGLLGWFTVVYNVCGFTNAPGLRDAASPNIVTAVAAQPYVNTYVGPIGNTVTASVLPAGAITPGVRVGYFCTSAAPNAATTPDSWNNGAGPGLTGAGGFKSSRCRKALDQFGRTATRCHTSTVAGAAGPAQAGGYSDPLRVLATGIATINSPQTPMGLNIWAPACN